MALRLTDLSKDESGTITGFDNSDENLCMRLREIGFAEGTASRCKICFG